MFLNHILFNQAFYLVRAGIASQLVKQPGHDVDHLPPFIAQVKNEWSHTLLPLRLFYGVDRDCFTFTLLPRI
jgi:hypothetical protein